MNIRIADEARKVYRMSSIGDKTNFFKNPIGVIGIFLVLIEAIASMVIVYSSLNDMQNTILVLFIVFFPCLVLAAFYMLVTRHHEKLYSPSDYRDEKNFVNTYNNITQQEETKIVKDVEEEMVMLNDKNITVVKEALVDLMELQKRIIPSVQNTVLSDAEKDDYVSSMEDYLLEIDDDYEELKVEISPMYKSTKLVEELICRGYDASIYRFGMEDKKVVTNVDHAAIWLGDRVPVDMAIEVIKIAKVYYPHLKYIHLSDAKDGAPEYVRYQIYIGGSTETAKKRGLKVLTLDEFDKMYEVRNQDELHSFVKSFE